MSILTVLDDEALILAGMLAVAEAWASRPRRLNGTRRMLQPDELAVVAVESIQEWQERDDERGADTER